MPRKRWPPSAVLDTREAAHHVGLTAGTLAKARRRGGGPAWIVLLKGTIRYRVSDLDAWLAADRRQSQVGHDQPGGGISKRRPRGKRTDGLAARS